jgi:hypothetical protein
MQVGVLMQHVLQVTPAFTDLVHSTPSRAPQPEAQPLALSPPRALFEPRAFTSSDGFDVCAPPVLAPPVIPSASTRTQVGEPLSAKGQQREPPRRLVSH